MIVYNLKSRHFTLTYDEIQKYWFAIRSGEARGYKVKLSIIEYEGIPVDIAVSSGETTLRDDEELNTLIEILQDASMFRWLIKNTEYERLEPIKQ